MRETESVFVGSSNERRRLAKQIATDLEGLKLDVLPWWSDRVFRPGDVTLDRLIELSQRCTGSVFVFGGDDKVWFRPKEKGWKGFAVRDNVLLEYGLFVARCARNHAVIVAEETVKLPSDVGGITVIFFRRGEKHANISGRVAAHFSRLLEDKAGAFQPEPKILLHADWTMPIHTTERVSPDNWQTVDLYGGREGAAAWSAVERDSDYARRTQTREAGAQVAKAIGNREVATIVSLGPGIGTVDSEVVKNLTSSRWREYIPVDVNRRLLLRSAHSVAEQSATTECVRGILCNFDTNLSFVGDIVHKYSNGPRLFLMAGGTFGNLTQTEGAILRGLFEIMGPNDLFVFDLFCWEAPYEIENDPLYNIGTSSTGVQNFFVVALEKLRNRKFQSKRAAIKDLVVQEQRATSLPGTKTLAIIDSVSNTTLLNIRRFVEPEIKRAMTAAGFSVVSARQVSSDGALKRHILLAQKAGRPAASK